MSPLAGPASRRPARSGLRGWLRRSLEELCAIDSTTGHEARLLPALAGLLEPLGADAPRLAALLGGRACGSRLFMLGPGSIELAHRDDEHLPWAELDDGVSILADLCRHWLAAEVPERDGGAGGGS